jgi:hypothetical protein
MSDVSNIDANKQTLMFRVLRIVLQAASPSPALIIAKTIREVIALVPLAVDESGKYNGLSSASQMSTTSQIGQVSLSLELKPRVTTSET